MAGKYILAGVGNVQLHDPSTGDIIVSSKTLTDSGISFTLTAEDIRGGMANKLLGQYFHDSGMTLTMTDALYSMEYLALNVGGTIAYGSDVMTVEQITTDVANKITVSETPQMFGTIGTIGWYTIAGKDDWKTITFDPTTKTAQVDDLDNGSTVCVKYIKEDASAEQFTVSSAFIPSQCYALLTLPLFKAGTENVTSYTSSSKVGEVQIEIPNFILAGAQDLSLTASGASTTALSGSALATFTGDEGCDGDGYYAKLKQITYNKDEFADVKSIVIANSDIELAPSEDQKLNVYGLYGGITAPRLLDNAKLTFTSSSENVTVGAHDGIVVAGETSGEAVIEVTVDGKPNLVAKAVVVVATA